MRRACLLLAALSFAMPSIGKDLGTIGPTYSIEEANLLDMITQRLREKEKSGELQRLQELAQANGRNAVLRPAPVPGLQPTFVARTFYFDPSITLENNILDEKGRVLFSAGTKKNPLDIVSMSKHLLFFDARDPKQVQRARELIDHYRGRVKPILVGGSYLDLMKAWRIPVYYDQQGMLIKRFRITQVPAIVSQEGLRLRIDEMVL